MLGRQKQWMSATRSTPAHQPSLHLLSEPQLTETICTELVGDLLLPNPRTFFSLYLTPLTSTSLLENLSSLGFSITNRSAKLSVSE